MLTSSAISIEGSRNKQWAAVRTYLDQTGPLSLVEQNRGLALIGQELHSVIIYQLSYAMKNGIWHPFNESFYPTSSSGVDQSGWLRGGPVVPTIPQISGSAKRDFDWRLFYGWNEISWGGSRASSEEWGGRRGESDCYLNDTMWSVLSWGRSRVLKDRENTLELDLSN